VAAIPLIASGQSIGVMFVNYRAPYLFTQERKELIELFGNQAAIAIQNARLFGNAQIRIRDMEIVNEVVQIISTKLDTQDLLQTIVSQIADRLNCTHCTIFFPQKEKDELLLVPRVVKGISSEHIKSRRFKPGEGLVGWVFQHGESLVLDDAREDPRFAPARVKEDQPRSMLVAPVKVGDRTIGVISADQDEFGWFSESDRRLVDALALQAGIAIERARGLELLQDISNRIISMQNVDDILQQIVSGAIKLTNTTSGVIWLISEDGRSVIRGFHPPDFEQPKPRLDREGGITRHVIETSEVLSIPDVRQDPRVNPVVLDRSRSLIAVPLKLEQRVIGVLYLNDENPHDFTETEVSLLLTLASQAAIAIENARLYADLLQKVKELEDAQSEIANKERALVIVTMAADYVHRVNNLAGTLPNWVALAKKQLDPDNDRNKQVLRYLEGIAQDSRLLLEEARRLRDPLPSPEEIDVYELIDSILAQMELIAAPEIDFVIQSEPNLGRVYAVRTQISDALFNVLDNGVKAISGAGQLSVSLKRDTDRPRDFIMIEISDTGHGIPPDRLETIFELGRTYRAGSKGIGYGLWRTRTIVEGIGGSISAESTAGEGTTFFITLPTIQSDKEVKLEDT
jgi:two-component system NtrC family sensor kinase